MLETFIVHYYVILWKAFADHRSSTFHEGSEGPLIQNYDAIKKLLALLALF